MTATIIMAHPWHGSFTKAILDNVVSAMEKANKAYQIIDLNKDGFNPVLQENELALYSKGEYRDSLVEKYQNTIKNSDEIVFIFPIWWYNVPAILKGFLDKVMLKNFSYTEGKSGLKGLLTHITKTTVITTSESPTWYLKYIVGNPIERIFIRATLKGIGLQNVKWLNHGRTTSGSDENRKIFLNKIDKHFAT